MITSTGCASNDSSRPIVGALRWDAWTGGNITAEVEKSLGPEKYHFRLPWFAEVIDENTVKIDGGKQAIMDKEIEMAADAGLDYWAFLIYEENSVMDVGIQQYLRSDKQGRIKFAMILANTLNSPANIWPAERDRALELMEHPNYQKVLDNRPLLYHLTLNDEAIERFEELRSLANKRGINPYCAFMGWHPIEDWEKVKHRGFDALSAYAGGVGNQPTYAEHAKHVEINHWQKIAEADIPYIPLVTTGWEKNPRKDNPVSWEIGQDYHTQEIFPTIATPEEIAQHLQNAIDFVNHNPDICQANALIIYAWNENDEGGWIAPTRAADGSPNTSRLHAISKVLKP